MRRNRSIVISYMNLRTLIGILGMLLPIMCYIWCYIYNYNIVLESISMHYYSNFRDIFVGILITSSVFLITYKGYNILDNIITVVIGISGIGIALFPCDTEIMIENVNFLMLNNIQTSIIHYLSAGLFFALLAFNSFYLFTKSKEKINRKSRKYYRNIIYRICGVSILIGLIGVMLTLFLGSRDFRNETHLILILETVMLIAFGISWLVKGGAIIKDKKLTTAST